MKELNKILSYRRRSNLIHILISLISKNVKLLNRILLILAKNQFFVFIKIIDSFKSRIAFMIAAVQTVARTIFSFEFRFI